METKTILVEAENYATAWAKAVVQLKNTKNLFPLHISFQCNETNLPERNNNIQSFIEKKIKSLKLLPINEVAYTIFPDELWRYLKNKGRENFYETYIKRILPTIKKRNRANIYGTYFERLISFKGVKNEKIEIINQLEYVIQRLSKTRKSRTTALQLAIINPTTDHTNQSIRGFPCLQQIGLSYNKNGLTLTAMYPTQYMISKAYGNYKGLYNLAKFISEASGIAVTNINVIVTHPTFDENLSKNEVLQIQSMI